MRRRYLAAGLCLVSFILAQTFQELAYSLWIPDSHSAAEELLTHLLPVNKVRALLVLLTLAGLLVPFAAIALRYVKAAPMASAIGLICGAAFIGFEVTHRSIEFFVVDARWASQFSAGAERDVILQRFGIWNDILYGWTFPQQLSYLVASCAFAVASWTETRRGGWYYLAPVAFGLNALRLLGRLLSTFAAQAWLSGLNNNWYFPMVLVVYLPLVAWFFVLARDSHGADA